MKRRASRSLLILFGFVGILIVAVVALSLVYARASGPAVSAATDLPSSAAVSGEGLSFVHVAQDWNTWSEHTRLYHPYMHRYDCDDILLVTPSISPYGGPDIYNDHPVGLWCDWEFGEWHLFNQGETPMPEGIGYSIMMTAADASTFVHEATSATMFGSSTRIDHPLANDDPNAILLVTLSIGENWSLPINDHSIGVWYDDVSSKWAILNQDGVAVPLDTQFNVRVATADPGAFVHTASAGNTVNYATFIDHPHANNRPYAIPLVTQNRNPGGGSPGTTNDHEIAVLYDEGRGQWAVVNQDATPMPPGTAFNVVIPDPDPELFTHEATTAGKLPHSTYFSHPLTDGDPYALLLATHSWNAGGELPGHYNNHAIAVRHNGTHWGIYNQDEGAIALGAEFNVLIPRVDAGVSLHWSTTSSTDGTSTYINHPATNGMTDALVFVTPNFSPAGVNTGVTNTHPIGVWYNSGEAKWAIFNEEHLVDMPVGAAFNFLVRKSGPTAFVHYATSGTITSNYTRIKHPLANGNPNAILLVTQNYNPGGVGGVHNPHEIGVWYVPGAQQWAIYNQDMAPMPLGAAFNVLITPYRVFLPLVVR